MTDFGGLGGVSGGREYDPTDLFEAAVERVLGEQIRASRGVGEELWGSLANVEWIHDNGDTASYTFRSAGDLIAAVARRGDYMDWYCCAQYGEATDLIRNALAKEGWRPIDSIEESP